MSSSQERSSQFYNNNNIDKNGPKCDVIDSGTTTTSSSPNFFASIRESIKRNKNNKSNYKDAHVNNSKSCKGGVGADATLKGSDSPVTAKTNGTSEISPVIQDNMLTSSMEVSDDNQENNAAQCNNPVVVNAETRKSVERALGTLADAVTSSAQLLNRNRVSPPPSSSNPDVCYTNLLTAKVTGGKLGPEHHNFLGGRPFSLQHSQRAMQQSSALLERHSAHPLLQVTRSVPVRINENGHVPSADKNSESMELYATGVNQSNRTVFQRLAESPTTSFHSLSSDAPSSIQDPYRDTMDWKREQAMVEDSNAVNSVFTQGNAVNSVLTQGNAVNSVFTQGNEVNSAFTQGKLNSSLLEDGDNKTAAAYDRAVYASSGSSSTSSSGSIGELRDRRSLESTITDVMERHSAGLCEVSDSSVGDLTSPSLRDSTLDNRLHTDTTFTI